MDSFGAVGLDGCCCANCWSLSRLPNFSFVCSITCTLAAMAACPDNLSRESARHALASLPRFERLVCGALIRRQLDRGPRADRSIAKYGPEGAVRLCSARAIQAYMYPVCFVAIGLTFAQANLAAGVAVTVLFVMFIAGISRVASAALAGRRWRTGRAGV